MEQPGVSVDDTPGLGAVGRLVDQGQLGARVRRTGRARTRLLHEVGHHGVVLGVPRLGLAGQVLQLVHDAHAGELEPHAVEHVLRHAGLVQLATHDQVVEQEPAGGELVVRPGRELRVLGAGHLPLLVPAPLQALAGLVVAEGQRGGVSGGLAQDGERGGGGVVSESHEDSFHSYGH